MLMATHERQISLRTMLFLIMVAPPTELFMRKRRESAGMHKLFSIFVARSKMNVMI